MKNLLFVFLLCVFIGFFAPIIFLTGFSGCDLQSDNEPKDVFGIWEPNPVNQSVTHYNVFWWQGDDTLSWSISNMVYQDSVLHVDDDSLVTNPYTLMNDYVRFGVTAVNSVGTSEMGLTVFYGYYDLFRPSTPQGQRVIR